MFCPKCGKPIADGFYTCPFCDEPLPVANNATNDNPKKTKKKKRKVGCLIGAVIIIAMITIIAVIIGSGNDDPTTSTDPSSNSSASQKAEEKEKAPTVIYEDDHVKASFIKVYSDANVDSVVEGVAYLQLRIENKTNQTYTVALTKTAINGMSTTMMSGLPMTLLPGNSSEQPFAIFTKNTSVNKADDIKKIQFSIYLIYEDINKVEETKTITINIK